MLTDESIEELFERMFHDVTDEQLIAITDWVDGDPDVAVSLLQLLHIEYNRRGIKW